MKTLLSALGVTAEEAAGYAKQLKQVEQAAQEGRLLFSLELLEQIDPLLVAINYQQSKRDVEQGGLEAFEHEWLRLGGELKDKRNQFASKSARPLPAAVQAIIERAVTQVQPHYQSGRLYGQNTTINAGLFYLGTALAQLQFAAFCQSLHFPAQGAGPPLRSLAPELKQMEKEILQAYRSADVATQQGIFNQINSALKVAQDLQQERRYYGTLLQYLETSRLLGTIKSQTEATPSLDSLNRRAEALRARLAGNNGDFSIGRLYLEMAQAALEAPTADSRGLRRANVILNQTMPRYFDYLARTKK